MGGYRGKKKIILSLLRLLPAPPYEFGREEAASSRLSTFPPYSRMRGMGGRGVGTPPQVGRSSYGAGTGFAGPRCPPPCLPPYCVRRQEGERLQGAGMEEGRQEEEEESRAAFLPLRGGEEELTHS